MNGVPHKLVIFSDLDGCLLNKADYDWSSAQPVLEQLRRLAIPVVLNSSKTVAEMTELLDEFDLTGTPFISENGGVIHWGTSRADPSGNLQVTGTPRQEILSVLASLKANFQFRSFTDLGISGIIEHTGLPRRKAELAADRRSTEPLLWDDSPARIDAFRTALQAHQLTLTRGGRFWHVAGPVSKGSAMKIVAGHYQGRYAPASVTTAGIGDSPIDQSMLDVADCPIGIPAGGSLNVSVDTSRGIVAGCEGSAGWAEAVRRLLLMNGVAENPSR